MNEKQLKEKAKELSAFIAVDDSDIKFEIIDFSINRQLGDYVHGKKKKVRISRRLLNAPKEILECVILHEFIHVRQYRENPKEAIKIFYTSTYDNELPWLDNSLEKEAYDESNKYMKIRGHNYTNMEWLNMKREFLGLDK